MKTTASPGHHLASPAPVVYCALFPFDTGLESDYLTALSPVKGEKSDPGSVILNRPPSSLVAERNVQLASLHLYTCTLSLSKLNIL